MCLGNGEAILSLSHLKCEDVAFAGAVGVIQAGAVPRCFRNEADGARFDVDFAANKALDVVSCFENSPPGAIVFLYVNREFLQNAGREAE